jgi:hypothetical protein
MARNDEEEIRKLEAEAVQLGYSAAEGSIKIGELELANQFRWIAGALRQKNDKRRNSRGAQTRSTGNKQAHEGTQ